MVSTFAMDLLKDPFFIGWDSFFKEIEGLPKNTSNYPPYNLVKFTDDTYMIELALAGFSKDDIEVSQEKNNLTIKGNIEEDGQESYIHKGIATRSFTRTFSLAEHIEIKHITWLNGILSVSLFRNVPENQKPKIFKIKDINE
jgi:molecular chaperone IbpA